MKLSTLLPFAILFISSLVWSQNSQYKTIIRSDAKNMPLEENSCKAIETAANKYLVKLKNVDQGNIRSTTLGNCYRKHRIYKLNLEIVSTQKISEDRVLYVYKEDDGFHVYEHQMSERTSWLKVIMPHKHKIVEIFNFN